MQICRNCTLGYAVLMSIPGLRERKKSETRRAITETALKLAVEIGPSHVTVEAIAASAGVSPRTVFNYFGTKDEAILGIDPASRAENIERLSSRPLDEAPLESLRLILRERITTVDETGEYWRTRAELVRNHPHLRAAQIASQVALEREMAEVIAARTGLDLEVDTYPALVVSVALTTLRHVLARTTPDGLEGLGDEIDAAFAQVSQGLPLPAAASVSSEART